MDTVVEQLTRRNEYGDKVNVMPKTRSSAVYDRNGYSIDKVLDQILAGRTVLFKTAKEFGELPVEEQNDSTKLYCITDGEDEYLNSIFQELSWKKYQALPDEVKDSGIFFYVKDLDHGTDTNIIKFISPYEYKSIADEDKTGKLYVVKASDTTSLLNAIVLPNDVVGTQLSLEVDKGDVYEIIISDVATGETALVYASYSGIHPIFNKISNLYLGKKCCAIIDGKKYVAIKTPVTCKFQYRPLSKMPDALGDNVVNNLNQPIGEASEQVPNLIDLNDRIDSLEELIDKANTMTISNISKLQDEVVGFIPKETVTNTDGTIVETYDDGRKIVTTESKDGKTITQKYYLSDGKLSKTKTTVEKSDGRIIETVVNGGE